MKGFILFTFSIIFTLCNTNNSLATTTVQQEEGEGIELPTKPKEKEFNAGDKALSHIVDANAFHLFGDYYFHLPVMLYAPDHGWTCLSSTRKFEPVTYGDGTLAIDRYVLNHGSVFRVKDDNFPLGTHRIEGFDYKYVEDEKGKEKRILQVKFDGELYDLETKSTVDGGLFGGSLTSYYDFSITKNVFSLLVNFFILSWIFLAVARAYKKRSNMAPKGLQSFMEPIILFIQDDVAKPFLGHNYERFMPFLLSLFFFILGLNLLGQVPFFPGSANVTGNIAVTMVLAIFTFVVVNINGNRNYWRHILWMPGVPAGVKLILTPVEIASMFIKPITLMLRLFASITAGHIVIIAFVSLIFIFGNAGESLTGSGMGLLISFPLTMFMFAIELVIALVQAFVFTILTASYLGAAVEEHH
nr:F0F1 ATP synthase subunit A [Saprospiraceae bacterium]